MNCTTQIRNSVYELRNIKKVATRNPQLINPKSKVRTRNPISGFGQHEFPPLAPPPPPPKNFFLNILQPRGTGSRSFRWMKGAGNSKLRPRPLDSGYFWNRIYFYVNRPSVHTEINESAHRNRIFLKSISRVDFLSLQVRWFVWTTEDGYILIHWQFAHAKSGNTQTRISQSESSCMTKPEVGLQVLTFDFG